AFVCSSRRRRTTSKRDWSPDVCSSDLGAEEAEVLGLAAGGLGLVAVELGEHPGHRGGGRAPQVRAPRSADRHPDVEDDQGIDAGVGGGRGAAGGGARGGGGGHGAAWSERG